MYEAESPALMLPDLFRAAVATGEIHVDFLNVGTSKNHVVFRVLFQKPVVLRSTSRPKYFGTRITVDLAEEAFLVLNDSEVSLS